MIKQLKTTLKTMLGAAALLLAVSTTAYAQARESIDTKASQPRRNNFLRLRSGRGDRGRPRTFAKEVHGDDQHHNDGDIESDIH